ncbi:MAG: hypothetical protein CMP48_20395 [Rickettsiales bacterium]|nr:hypothetical protein [Rickettsiales bacterium]
MCLAATAQNSVGIGTETPNSNAVLHLVSPDGNQGFLVPQVSTTERTATTFTDNLASDDQGLLVFDSTEQVFYYWSGSVWTSLSAQQLTAGTGLSIVDGTISNTGDLDDQNEIQDLSLSGNDLTITNNSSSTTIDLSPYLDNTDSQTLSFTSTTLAITGGNSVDLASLQDGTGTDDQTATEVPVTSSGNLASTNVQDALSELQGDIDGISDTDDQTATEVTVTPSGNLTSTNVQDALSEIQGDVDGISDTDDQTASEVVVTASGNLTSTDVQSALQELQADIDAGSAGGDMLQSVYDTDGNSTVDDAETVNGLTVLTAVPAGAVFTDAQSLSFDGSSLTLSGGNTVNLSSLGDDADADASNEIQDLTFDRDVLGLSGSATTFDLSGYMDNTDAQSLSFDGTNLDLTNGGSVDLSSLSDGTGTDDQNLSFAGTTLTIESGNSVNLSSLQDGTGTDDQTATEVSVTAGNGMTSTNVQSALAEHQTDINSHTSSISSLNSSVSSLQSSKTEFLTLRASDFVVEGATNSIELGTEGNKGFLISAENNSIVTATAVFRLPNGASVDAVTGYLDQGKNGAAASMGAKFVLLNATTGTQFTEAIGTTKADGVEQVDAGKGIELIDNSRYIYYIFIQGSGGTSSSVGYAEIYNVTIQYSYNN